MVATLSEVIQFCIGAAVGLGISNAMAKNGISIFCRETRETAISAMIIFVCAWIIGMTLLLKVFGE